MRKKKLNNPSALIYVLLAGFLATLAIISIVVFSVWHNSTKLRCDNDNCIVDTIVTTAMMTAKANIQRSETAVATAETATRMYWATITMVAEYISRMMTAEAYIHHLETASAATVALTTSNNMTTEDNIHGSETAIYVATAMPLTLTAVSPQATP